MSVVVTRHERVGKDWETCQECGCKFPPQTWCPYIEYHAGFSDPHPVFPSEGK